MVICLERGAALHMAQLMPLPLTVSCFSKIQIGFAFLVLAYPGSPGQRAVKRMCMSSSMASLTLFLDMPDSSSLSVFPIHSLTKTLLKKFPRDCAVSSSVLVKGASGPAAVRLTWLSSVTSRWRSASAYVTDIALDALSKT